MFVFHFLSICLIFKNSLARFELVEFGVLVLAGQELPRVSCVPNFCILSPVKLIIFFSRTVLGESVSDGAAKCIHFEPTDNHGSAIL